MTNATMLLRDLHGYDAGGASPVLRLESDASLIMAVIMMLLIAPQVLPGSGVSAPSPEGDREPVVISIRESGSMCWGTPQAGEDMQLEEIVQRLRAEVGGSHGPDQALKLPVTIYVPASTTAGVIDEVLCAVQSDHVHTTLAVYEHYRPKE